MLCEAVVGPTGAGSCCVMSGYGDRPEWGAG